MTTDELQEAARYVVQLANQPGMDDDEWEQAMTALESALGYLCGAPIGRGPATCQLPAGHVGFHEWREVTASKESCCSEENPHRAIPTITDRPRSARHWFDEAAAFTVPNTATDIEAAPADDGRVRSGRRVHAVGDRDPGVGLASPEPAPLDEPSDGTIDRYRLIQEVRRAARGIDHSIADEPDDVLLSCRNLGATSLAWIREQAGDPKSPFADLEDENADLRMALAAASAELTRLRHAIEGFVRWWDEPPYVIEDDGRLAEEVAVLRAAIKEAKAYREDTDA